jgi:single-strand DNA-binding protein
VGDLAIAINQSYKTAEGQLKEEVTYVDIVAWGRQAETCKEFLTKGSPILVEGRLQLDQWEKDGEKKSRLRVRAERIQFLGRPRSAEGEGSGSGASSGGYRRSERSDSPAPRPAPERHAAPSHDDGPPPNLDDDDIPF